MLVADFWVDGEHGPTVTVGLRGAERISNLAEGYKIIREEFAKLSDQPTDAAPAAWRDITFEHDESFLIGLSRNEQYGGWNLWLKDHNSGSETTTGGDTLLNAYERAVEWLGLDFVPING